MPTPAIQLILEARRQLGLQQRELADFLGVSVRTVARYNHTGGVTCHDDTIKLIRAIHPRDPKLATQLAAAIGVKLPDLGILPPPAATPKPAPAPLAVPPPAPAGPPPARREHADAVICAAADALNQLPRDVRPAVAEIFARVRELGVDLDGLTRLLAQEKPAAAKDKR